MFKQHNLTLEKSKIEPESPIGKTSYFKKISDSTHGYMNPLSSLSKSDTNVTKSTSSNGYRFKFFNNSGPGGLKNMLREEDKVAESDQELVQDISPKHFEHDSNNNPLFHQGIL